MPKSFLELVVEKLLGAADVGNSLDGMMDAVVVAEAGGEFDWAVKLREVAAVLDDDELVRGLPWRVRRAVWTSVLACDLHEPQLIVNVCEQFDVTESTRRRNSNRHK